MGEGLGSEKGIRQFDIPADTGDEASQFLKNDPELLNQLMSCGSALEVRSLILSKFDKPADLSAQPATILTSFQSAVLSEAVGRWNKGHPLDKEK